MEKKAVLQAIKKLKEEKKRNFKQSFDLIVNLKELDLKKAENQVDFYVPLHYSRGKKVKICCFAGPELMDEAKKTCDTVVSAEDFEAYSKDKKKVKKLAEDNDYFIAQATVMPKVAGAFGKVLGVRGKMPNPKAGCVVPPKANLKPLLENLQKLVRVRIIKDMTFMTYIGTEEMNEEEIADNVITLYNQIIHHLPNEENNIKNVYLKLTMGKPVKV